MKIAKVEIMWDLAAGLSGEARDFIGKLLKYHAKERMTLADALTHPWIVLNTNAN
jgi:serine/threonine protein kinase